jgi:hypothetical protein
VPYKKPADGREAHKCEVCGSPANSEQSGYYLVLDCSRCGDFQVGREAKVNWLPLSNDEQQRALAGHLIRRMQASKRPILADDFFTSLSQRTLPTPARLCDNLLLWFSEAADGRVGKVIGAGKTISDLDLLASIGAIGAGDAKWAVEALNKRGLINVQFTNLGDSFRGQITPEGWDRIEELQLAHVASRYAFFARQFKNDDLDSLYDNCLKQAVVATGFELHTVTQKAGHIDAIIEDEIRRGTWSTK